MSATVSSSTLTSEVREVVAARVEQQMRSVHSAAVATLMSDGHTFAAIRDALTAKALGDPNWKAGLR